MYVTKSTQLCISFVKKINYKVSDDFTFAETAEYVVSSSFFVSLFTRSERNLIQRKFLYTPVHTLEEKINSAYLQS